MFLIMSISRPQQIRRCRASRRFRMCVVDGRTVQPELLAHNLHSPLRSLRVFATELLPIMAHIRLIYPNFIKRRLAASTRAK
jgi:hypothetical protein